MAASPSFDDVVAMVRHSLRQNGWPERIVWRKVGDILRLSNGRVLVRRWASQDAETWAHAYYAQGIQAGVCVALSAECLVDGITCLTLFWTTDADLAERMLLPETGFKLSHAIHKIEALEVGPIGWWVGRIMGRLNGMARQAKT